MNSFYIKTRVQEKKPVRLSVVKVKSVSHVLMAYPSGYLQTMTLKEFNSGLASSFALSPENPELMAVRDELDVAINKSFELL